MNSKKNFFIRKRNIVLAIILALILLAMLALDSRLLIRKYTVEAEEITDPIRIALATDLHSCKYGEDQTELIKAIDAHKPDVILLGGDIFDDVKEDTNAELFLAGIAEKYPCYYVTGNHECWSGSYNFSVKMSILEKYDITILSGETVTLTVNGESINLCGIDDPHIYMVEPYDASKQNEYLDENGNRMKDYTDRLNALHEAVQNDNYTILLSHRPEFFELYSDHDFDLVLCGHSHGGQWRIPLLLNGLYAPHQGIFPKYAGGRYDAEGITMIVSRGLARESTRIPRIFNRPELVIVDIR